MRTHPTRLVIALFFSIAIAQSAAAQNSGLGRIALPFVPLSKLPPAPDGDFRISNSKQGSGPDINDFAVIDSLCRAKATWQDVELYDGSLGPTRPFVDATQPATALLQWRDDLESRFPKPENDPGNVSGERWCSGTLIAKDLILTAAHCLQVQTSIRGVGGWHTPRRGQERTPLQPNELAPLFVANFRYQIDRTTKELNTPEVFPVLRLVEYGFDMSPDNLDFAILQVGSDAQGRLPGGHFSVAEIDASDTSFSSTESLTLIQHPNGLPKKIAAGPLAAASGNFIQYRNLDTLGGSSGAGILSTKGRLIGVHTNGGCDTIGTNQGVALRSIRNISKVVH